MNEKHGNNFLQNNQINQKKCIGENNYNVTEKKLEIIFHDQNIFRGMKRRRKQNKK